MPRDFLRPFCRLMAGLLVSSVALTATPPANPSAYVARFDRDDDGRVSLAEYQAYLMRGFLRMDSNGDGRIEGPEWPQPGRPLLTLESHRSHLVEAFGRQDRNHDGFLDSAELTAPPR